MAKGGQVNDLLSLVFIELLESCCQKVNQLANGRKQAAARGKYGMDSDHQWHGPDAIS